jgi:hypothetical protein
MNVLVAALRRVNDVPGANARISLREIRSAANRETSRSAIALGTDVEGLQSIGW